MGRHRAHDTFQVLSPEQTAEKRLKAVEYSPRLHGEQSKTAQNGAEVNSRFVLCHDHGRDGRCSHGSREVSAVRSPDNVIPCHQSAGGDISHHMEHSRSLSLFLHVALL